VLECPDWSAQYQADPTSALDPVEAYARWRDGGKKAERRTELAEQIASTDSRRAAMHDRFARPADILE
jgi:hypothetical protein